MKRLSFIILIVICITETVNAQSSTFDSSYVLLSSDIYDYKNPTFENLYDPYNVRQSDRFVYEIHSGLKSNLQIKTFTFDSEDSAISITSDNYKNINASFSGDMIVWQSNKYGKQDLFYSLFNGLSWSSPEIIDTSQGDKIQPNIHFTRYLDIYCISYQKNNDVYFKYYRGGIWSADTNLTSSINEICHTPVLKGNYYNMSVLFIQE